MRETILLLPIGLLAVSMRLCFCLSELFPTTRGQWARMTHMLKNCGAISPTYIRSVKRRESVAPINQAVVKAAHNSKLSDGAPDDRSGLLSRQQMVECGGFNQGRSRETCSCLIFLTEGSPVAPESASCPIHQELLLDDIVRP